MLTTQHSLFEVNESNKNAYFLRTNKHAKIKSTQRKKRERTIYIQHNLTSICPKRSLSIHNTKRFTFGVCECVCFKKIPPIQYTIYSDTNNKLLNIIKITI